MTANPQLSRWYRNRPLLAYLALSAACGAVAASLEDIRFETLLDNESLPTPWIRQVHQDSEGFLWFLTHNTPLRYDGTGIENMGDRFRASSSREFGRANRIAKDSSGRTWILTSNALHRFARLDGSFQSFPLLDDSGRSLTRGAFCLNPLENGWIAVGGNHGLFLFDPATETWVRKHTQIGGRSLHVRDTHHLNGEEILVAASSGLWKYDLRSGEFDSQRLMVDNGPALEDEEIRRVLVDQEGRIWITRVTSDIQAFDRRGEEIPLTIEGRPISDYSFRAYQDIHEDRHRIIWVAPAEGGLIALHPGGSDFKHFRSGRALFNSPPDHTILDIEELEDGTLCFSTRNSGIFMLDANRIPLRHYSSDQQDSSLVFKLVSDIEPNRDGTLWVAGPLNQIARYDPETERFSYPLPEAENASLIESTRLEGLAEDPEGNLVFHANDERVLRYDMESNRITQLATMPAELPGKSNNQNPTAMVFDREGYLWILRRNLVRFDPKSGEFHVPSVNEGSLYSEIRARCVAELSNGDFWIGSIQRGLAYYDRSEDEVAIRFPATVNPQRFQYNSIIAIEIGPDGRLWIGTTNGLTMLDPETEEFDNFEDLPQLDRVLINGLEFDRQGRLWISSSTGLMQLSLETREIRRFTRNQGMLAQTFTQNAFAKLDDGTLAIGGANGLNVMRTDRLNALSRPLAPRIVSTAASRDAEFDNARAVSTIPNPRGPMQFKYGTKALRFDFARLNYSKYLRVDYKFAIDGLTKDWVSLGDTSTINLASLPPGDFVLRLKAFGLDGVPDSDETTLALSISPPFWQTTPMFALSALVVFALVFAAVKIRTYAIMKRNCLLESNIAERTKELEESRAQALDAATAKSDFLACMSHEIRTPMNGIVSMNEMLMMSDDLPSHLREYSKIIDRSSDSLLTLIDEILDFSKIEAGMMELEEAPFNVRELVEDTAELLALKASEKGLKLRCLSSPDMLEEVVGDSHRFRQAITNLVGNAIKFTESGSVTIAVNSARESGDRIVCDIRVEDTGIGISADRQSKLFEPFTQADGSTSRKYGGTGLGLSITRRIVEAMGGNIELESEAGRGSEFRISVNLRAGSEDAPKDRFREALVGKTVHLSLHDREDAKCMGRWLQWSGAEVFQIRDSESLAATLSKSSAKGKTIENLIVDSGLIDSTAMLEIVRLKENGNLRVIVLGEDSEDEIAVRKAIADCSVNHIARPLAMIQMMYSKRYCDSVSGERKETVALPRDIASPLALVVDDNDINRQVLMAALEQVGCEVREASDGLEAVDMANRADFDIVFMDCMMPQVDGFEASQQIRSNFNGRNRDVPIIAITANAMKGDRERCLESGMSDYMAKPIRMEGLRRLIADWLPGRTNGIGEFGDN